LRRPTNWRSTLGVSKSFIYKAVERNEIPHLRLGSLIRFDLNEVRAWLLSKRVRPSAPAASAAT
jgi:excisionase family DNA binding protein